MKVLLAAEQPTTRAIPSKEVQDLQYTYKSLGPHSGEASNNLFSLLFKRNKLNILKKFKKKCWIDFFFSLHTSLLYIYWLTSIFAPRKPLKFLLFRQASEIRLSFCPHFQCNFSFLSVDSSWQVHLILYSHKKYSSLSSA